MFDKNGKFDRRYLRSRGINEKGIIYCLDRLIEEDKFDIIYKIVPINFDNPKEKKEEIIGMMKDGYIAIIHVGSTEISPLSFSQHGYYLVIRDIDKKIIFM